MKKEIPPAHCEMSNAIQRKARVVLREEIKNNPDYATDNLSADVIIEQVWNVLAGLDKID